MRDEPRVLFINHAAELGGAEQSLQQLVSLLPNPLSVALLSNGPLFDLLTRRGIRAFVVNGADELVSVGKGISTAARLWDARQLPSIVRELAKEARQTDVIYANSKKAVLFAALAAWSARKPLIWHQRDAMLLPSGSALRVRASENLLIRLLNRYAARVISVSRASADTLIAAGGRADLPVVIHNGLDPVRYAQSVNRGAVRRAAGLPVNATLVGCFGRLSALKGQAVLINALASLPEAHAVLVGGAIFGESGYEAMLRARIERLGLAQRAHFLGHRDDVPALMRAVDVVAHPSTEFDPCPRVVLEALHSEAPLVATAVGGVPELVEDGVSGLLVPPRDATALAGALQRVLEDEALAARLAAAGRVRALRDFTLERVVREVERVIREVAET